MVIYKYIGPLINFIANYVRFMKRPTKEVLSGGRHKNLSGSRHKRLYQEADIRGLIKRNNRFYQEADIRGFIKMPT